jgi:putative FmdB family regulatory protein
MPTYPYACPACEAREDHVRSIHDAEPTYMCQNCGYRLVRTYEPTPVSFKGGGFYQTDKNR